MDRAPLDLYAFSNNDAENKAKTEALRQKVVRDNSFVSGEIIFVFAAGNELMKRNLGRGRPAEKAGEASYLETQTETLRGIYKPVIEFCTDSYSSGELARKVARHALMEDYCPTDLNTIMDRYA